MTRNEAEGSSAARWRERRPRPSPGSDSGDVFGPRPIAAQKVVHVWMGRLFPHFLGPPPIDAIDPPEAVQRARKR